MSASPSGPPSGPPSNGRTPTPNSGGEPRIIRRPRPADPLRQNNRPLDRRQRPTPGLRKPGPPSFRNPVDPKSVGRPGVNGVRPNPPAGPNGAIVGFSKSPEGDFQDFPLVTTKRALREGIRYHVARFSSKRGIDPTDQDEFVRPVSLHRRDPRQPPPGKVIKEDDAGPLDDKERERDEIVRAEKDAKRAADLAQIAPMGNNAAAMATKRTPARQEKTSQVFRNDRTVEQKKESDLRYEEALPWHLEDAENKHTWVGNYEAALSATNVILVIDGNKFRMVPLEKWYKFTPKNQFKTMTIEEAEAQMSKKSKASRWVMHADDKKKADRENEDGANLMRGGLFTVKYGREGRKAETVDANDIDFEGDLFEDDDEQMTVEPDNDEETKAAQEKIKREQLGANLFGEANENEVDKEIAQEEQEAERRKQLGRGINKALQKREKNYLYDSDESYSSSSSGDETNDEKQKEEERRKEEEAKLRAKSASKVASGTSSKGSTTPTGRPKHGDPSKRHNQLKRPGSPNLSASETSGNESSRKKHKKKHISSSSQPTGTSTPIPGSRPMSPIPSSQPLPSHTRKSSIVKLNLNPSKLSEIQSTSPNPSAVMSDGEATGGEMSDGGQRKKIKIRLGGGTPSASRAGSPAAGSRAGSPSASVNAQSQNTSTEPKPITGPEIVAALPAEGIAISGLLKLFSGRLKGNGKDKEDREKFIALVKQHSTYNPEDKLLRPKA